MSDIDVTVEFITQTDLAIRIKDGNQEMWLPKSQIKEIDKDYDNLTPKIIITILIPEWLAIAKGLI